MGGNNTAATRRLQTAQSNGNSVHVANNELAACIINNYQGTMLIGRAGLVIATFQKTCKPGPGWRAACATSVLGLVATLGNIAAYFAAVSSQCASGVNKRALCATDISQIVAASSAFSAAGLNVKESCAPHNLHQHWQLAATSMHDEHKKMESVMTDELNKLSSKDFGLKYETVV